jgi:hypothetical protein
VTVDEASLDVIEEAFGRRLPTDYRTHLVTFGAGQLETLSDDHIELWSLDTVAAVNRLPEVRNLFPYLLYFGGDGGREHLAFDYRNEPPRVVTTDLTSGENGIVEQAGTFGDFLISAHSRGLMSDLGSRS